MDGAELKNGSLVVIRHSREGGEIIDTDREDGRVLVKVARMKLNATGIKIEIVKVLTDLDDLEPIKKQKGIIKL